MTKLLLLLPPLLLMAIEDFRYRAIHWAWLVLLSVGVIICFPFDLRFILMNLLLVGFQLFALTLFFSIKQGKVVFLPKQHLGWGDILFFVPLCLLFSPGNLIAFLVFSLVVAILGFVLCRFLLNKQVETIPLAGIFSICLVGALGMYAWLGYDLREDGELLDSIRKCVLYHQ